MGGTREEICGICRHPMSHVKPGLIYTPVLLLARLKESTGLVAYSTARSIRQTCSPKRGLIRVLHVHLAT